MGKRTTIDNPKRTGAYSKRATKGKLSVIKKSCKNCGHHKCFVKNSGIFCTKCGEIQTK